MSHILIHQNSAVRPGPHKHTCMAEVVQLVGGVSMQWLVYAMSCICCYESGFETCKKTVQREKSWQVSAGIAGRVLAIQHSRVGLCLYFVCVWGGG